jgi:hypothetical protein
MEVVKEFKNKATKKERSCLPKEDGNSTHKY